jgi:hypothetical protein
MDRRAVLPANPVTVKATTANLQLKSGFFDVGAHRRIAPERLPHG